MWEELIFIRFLDQNFLLSILYNISIKLEHLLFFLLYIHLELALFLFYKLSFVYHFLGLVYVLNVYASAGLMPFFTHLLNFLF
jgi:hypothetical protein